MLRCFPFHLSAFIYNICDVYEWRPFAHIAIDHQPLTALEQWKASRHRLLRVAVVNRNVGKRDAPSFEVLLFE